MNNGIDPVTQAFIDYEGACETWITETSQAIALRMKADAAKAELANLEATITANGGTENHPVTGSNAESRKAQIQVALVNHPDYAEITERMRRALAAQFQSDANATDAEHTMRQALAFIKYQTALVEREASIGGRIRVQQQYSGAPGISS